jgi:hypothetical protein
MVKKFILIAEHRPHQRGFDFAESVKIRGARSGENRG